MCIRDSPRDGYELVWLDRYHNTGYLNQLQYLIYVSDYRLPSELPYYEIQDGDSTSEVCSAIAEYKLEQVQIEQYLKPEFGIFGLEGKMCIRDRDAVVEGIGVIGNSKLIIDDTPGISIMELRSKDVYKRQM